MTEISFQDQHQHGGNLSPDLIDKLDEIAAQLAAGGTGPPGPPGPQGDPGATGDTGPAGAAGPGLAAGGTTGQVARKASNANYDTEWHTLVKADVGLSSVDNTADTAKPVSSAQQTAIDGKVTSNTAITGATKTKITYDTKGLVTAGADATTADIADSANKRYVTDANLTTLGLTSGTNTGDQTLVGLGGVPTTRALTINGEVHDLSADRTWTVTASTPDLIITNTTPTTDETITALYCAVMVDEYIMDATHELIFSDPSEMMVI